MGVTFKPMLCQTADESRLEELLTNDEWFMEPKLDGHRVMIVGEEGNARVLNRSGEPKVNGFPVGLLERLKGYFSTCAWWFVDGELLSDCYWIFDMAGEQFFDTNAPWIIRRSEMETSAYSRYGTRFKRTPFYAGAQKKPMLEQILANHGEGVVFKHSTSPYLPGKRSSAWLKYKQEFTADVILTDAGRNGKKHNIGMAVVDPDNNRIVDLGTVSTWGKVPFPRTLDVAEVKFLYCVHPESPKLVQPRILRIRHDKHTSECTINQLTHTFTNKNLHYEL